MHQRCWRRFFARRKPTQWKRACSRSGNLACATYPHDFLLKRVWTLRNNFTAYDAVYVALAEALNARLLTRDRRLAAEVGRHVDIELA
jgi:predicted nucleic acid-binding protein